MTHHQSDGAAVRPFVLLELVNGVNDAVGSLAELPAPAAHEELTRIAVGLRAEMLARGVPETEAAHAMAQFAAVVAEQLAYARMTD